MHLSKEIADLETPNKQEETELTNEVLNSMTFLILAHVKPYKTVVLLQAGETLSFVRRGSVLSMEEKRYLLRQLRFTHSGAAKEQHCERPIGIYPSTLTQTDSIRYHVDRPTLAYKFLPYFLLELQQ